MGGFLVLAALVGVGVGLGAAGLVLLLEAVQRLLAPLLAPLFNAEEVGFWSLQRAWIFLTVPLGLLIAWWIAKRFAPEVAGDGVPEAAAALAIHGGRMRKRVIPLKMLTTAITIGSGGSAGREGPLVQIGAAVGSWISRIFKLGEEEVRSLVARYRRVLQCPDRGNALCARGDPFLIRSQAHVCNRHRLRRGGDHIRVDR